MPRCLRSVGLSVAALVVPVMLACGGGDADGTVDSLAADSAAGSAADGGAAMAAAPTAGGPAAEAELQESDIELYERGLAAEIEILNEAIAQRASARTAEDTMNAMFAALPMQTVPAAAERARLDVQRYRRLDNAFGPVLSARLMNPTLRGLAAGADTSHFAGLRAEQQAQLRANMRESEAAFSDSATYHAIPPAMRDAFMRRAEAQLDTLWRERFALLARAAGIGG